MEVIQLHKNNTSHLQDLSLLEKEPPILKQNNPQIVQERFSLFPQMPVSQLKHFLTRACQTKKEIIVQINPSQAHQKYVEVTGQVKVLKEKKQIFVTSPFGGFTYLLNPKLIRHIRLLDWEDKMV